MNLIKLLNHNEKKSFLVLIFILIIHLLFLDLYPVNDEYIFPVGAKLIENFEINEISLFFNFNANTLGFSTLLLFFSKLLPFDYYTIGKLLSSSGLILIYLAVYALFKKLNLSNFKDKHILILLILFNPLIFIFSFRSTPDFFASALSFFSIIYFLNNNNSFMKLFFIILFSVSVIVKPFNAILILLIFFEFNYQLFFSKKNVNLLVWSFLFLIISCVYFIYNYYLFDFFLIPDQFKLARSFSIKNYFITFLSYIGFLNLFLMPLYLNLFIKSLIQNPLKILIYIFISILFSLFLMEHRGELNFGFLQKFLHTKIYFFIISLSFFIFFDFIMNTLKNLREKKYSLNFIFLIIIFLIILSNFQPTQRYLLSIIPLSLFLFFTINNIKSLQIMTIIIYCFMNIPLISNHYYTSKNIENIIEYLKQNDILDDTIPGYIEQHALNYFIDFDKDIEISMSKETLFNVNKKYYVTDIEPLNKNTIIFLSKSNNIFKKNRNLYLIYR